MVLERSRTGVIPNAAGDARERCAMRPRTAPETIADPAGSVSDRARPVLPAARRRRGQSRGASHDHRRCGGRGRRPGRVPRALAHRVLPQGPGARRRADHRFPRGRRAARRVARRWHRHRRRTDPRERPASLLQRRAVHQRWRGGARAPQGVSADLRAVRRAAIRRGRRSIPRVRRAARRPHRTSLACRDSHLRGPLAPVGRGAARAPGRGSDHLPVGVAGTRPAPGETLSARRAATTS